MCIAGPAQRDALHFQPQNHKLSKVAPSPVLGAFAPWRSACCSSITPHQHHPVHQLCRVLGGHAVLGAVASGQHIALGVPSAGFDPDHAGLAYRDVARVVE